MDLVTCLILRMMNERLDYILILLSIEYHFWCGINKISDAFEKAGLGSPYPYLKRLVEEGYIEQRAGEAEDFRLNEKGEDLYLHGGFVWRDSVAHEVQKARLATVVTIIAILLFAVAMPAMFMK